MNIDAHSPTLQQLTSRSSSDRYGLVNCQVSLTLKRLHCLFGDSAKYSSRHAMFSSPAADIITTAIHAAMLLPSSGRPGSLP